MDIRTLTTGFTKRELEELDATPNPYPNSIGFGVVKGRVSEMSSTGRSPRKSQANDVYPTPEWAITRFCEQWEPANRNTRMTWLEPCAGAGAIILAVDRYRSRKGLPPIRWIACELRIGERRHLKRIASEVHIGDFLGPRGPSTYIEGKHPKIDVGIMNPPFFLTMGFLEKLLAMCDTVALLQKQTYSGSNERNEFFQDFPPSFHLIPDRIDFVADGKCDSVYHGWFTWGDGLDRAYRILDSTPVETRREQRPRISYDRPIPSGKIKVRRKKKT